MSSFFIHTGLMSLRYSSTASSTVLCSKLFDVSIKRCPIGHASNWCLIYTILHHAHIRQSTRLRSWLFSGRKSGGINFGVLRWRSSIFWREWCAGALSCPIQQLIYLHLFSPTSVRIKQKEKHDNSQNINAYLQAFFGKTTLHSSKEREVNYRRVKTENHE